MSFSPVEHILGVPASADAATLLGLGPGGHDRVAIEAALRARLDETYVHPDGRTPDAEIARRALRLAAARLTEAVAGTASCDLRPLARRVHRGAHRAVPPRPQLTEFDRSVLATLVGSGGWNAGSRARLVALASTYGVSAAGLLRVMRGLSAYAAAGGQRLALDDIAHGAPRVSLPPTATEAGTAEGRLGERMDPESVVEGPWPTVKLSILFGLITIFAFVLLLRLMWPEPIETAPPLTESAIVAGTETPAAGDGRRPGPTGPSVSDPRRLAVFPRPPTFLGNALPPVATDAADRCTELAEQLDDVARRLSITDDPSEAAFRLWEDAILTISTGWVLVDDSTRRVIDVGLGEVLHEGGDSPATTDRLLAALRPSLPLLEPIDVWRAAWQAGTLGTIAASRVLPPSVVERARIILDEALREQVGGGFAPAADAWLRQVTSSLADRIERDAQIEDYWEVWLAAQRELDEPALRGHGSAARERLDVALMTAIHAVLVTATDLSRPGPSANVLGRLLTITDFETSVAVRDRVGLLFDEPAVSTHDLWVLTSLLARLDTAPWFDESLVLPHDAGTPYRNRLRDRIAAQWPADSAASAEFQAARGRGVMVDPRAGARWMALLDRMGSRPVPDRDTALMERLLLASRLNEAAGQLASRNVAAADEVLDALEAALAEGAGAPRAKPGSWLPNPRRRARAGQSVGGDGDWSAAYLDLSRNTEERLHALRGLRNRPGTDLGPLDAEVFVREAYRGSPREVRSLARAIAVEQFARGPNVALEMLDQFPDAPRNERMSETIRMLTGRLLPPARSESWPALARLALVEHALSLRPAGRTEIDVLAEAFRDSLVQRAVLVRREAGRRVAGAGAVEDRALGGARRSRRPVTPPGDAPPTRAGDDPGDGGRSTRRPRQSGLRDGGRATLGAGRGDRRPRRGRRGAQPSRACARAGDRDRAFCGVAMGVAHDARGAAVAGVPAMMRRLSPALLTLLMTVATLTASAPRAAAAGGWERELEALRPVDPLAYFELGEEIADAAADEEERELARRLFRLSGLLDRRLARSSCLALADLAGDEQEHRRLTALAALLGGSGIAPPGAAEREGPSLEPGAAAALAVTEAFSHYRRGKGSRAMTALRTPGARELLDSCDRFLYGGVHRFLEDCKLYRGRLRPGLSEVDRVRMLRLEIALLTGEERPWSSELLYAGGRPLVEVDPDQLEEAFRTDGSRPVYRAGRWVPAGPTP